MDGELDLLKWLCTVKKQKLLRL